MTQSSPGLHWGLPQRALWSACLLLVLYVLWPSKSLAAELLTLRSGQESYAAGRHLGILEDKAGTLTLQDMLAGQAFVPSQTDSPNMGYTGSVFWFRLDLLNRDAKSADWLLDTGYPLLNHVDVYLCYPDGKVVTLKGGNMLPMSQRAIKHRNIVFRIPLEQGQGLRIFIRVQSVTSIRLPLTLSSTEGFLAKDHDEQHMLGLYYGIMLAMLFYNLMIFFSIRDINYLYYVYYIGAWIVFQMALNGLAFEYLWPDSAWWGNIAPHFLIGLTGSGICLFARSFLQLGQNLPRFDRVVRIYFWVFLAWMPVSLVVHHWLVNKLVSTVILTHVLLIATVGALSLRKGVRQARYFMLAWAVLLVGIVLYVLKVLDFLPAVFLTEYGAQIGSALETVLLSFALADRMRILKDEKAAAQLQLIAAERRAANVLRDANETLQSEIALRRQAEDAALASREKYRALFDMLPVGVCVTDEAGQVVEANRASRAIGCELAIQPPPEKTWRAMHPDGRAVPAHELPAALALREQRLVESVKLVVAPMQTAQAERRTWLDVTAAPIQVDGYGVAVVYVDITERVRLEQMRKQQEAELLRVSRLSTVGEMGSALAHELNQPLAAVLNYLHGLDQRFNAANWVLEDVREAMRKAVRQGERAAEIVKRVHGFTRKHTPHKTLLDLHELVAEMVEFAAFDIRRNAIEVRVQGAADTCRVMADRIEIGQVLLNLIRNAVEAMALAGKAERILTLSILAHADCAEVVVADRGNGIPETDSQKIFEAFYTTRPEGMGLGLAIARTIVQAHGGHLRYRHNEHGGASFHFFLPSERN